MSTITLRHCVPTRIFSGPDENPPQQVTVTLNVGGASGDGAVTVVGAPPPNNNVPTGGSGAVNVPGANEVLLHYFAPPDKPQSVDVDYALLVL